MLPTAVACFHAQHTHDWWSAPEFCVRLGLFAVVQNVESAANNFCARPSKFLRTSQQNFAYVPAPLFLPTSHQI